MPPDPARIAETRAWFVRARSDLRIAELVCTAAPHDFPPLMPGGSFRPSAFSPQPEGRAHPTSDIPHPRSTGFRFLAVSTSGTLQTDFSTVEAGKTAYYALRWLSPRGETGPWSEITAATVAA